MKQVYIENFRDVEPFVREEEQFREKAKLNVLHTLLKTIAFSHLRKTPDSRHCDSFAKRNTKS